MKVMKMMRTLMCAFALLMPLGVPMAAHAQTAPDRTVTFRLAVTGTPCNDTTYWGYTAIVQSGGISYVQLTDPDQDGVYTGTAAPLYDGAKAVVSLVQGTGVAQSSPVPGGTPIPVPGAPSRVIADFGTQEQDGLRYLPLNADFVAEGSVNGCAAAPSATPAPSASAAPATDKTITFSLAVTGTSCQNATYWGYTAILQSDGIRYTRLTDSDGDGVYTGAAPAIYAGAKVAVQIVQGTGVKQVNFPTAGGPLVDVPGEPSRVLATFGTEHQDGFTFLTLNNDFVAQASVNGCAAAPSATPSATATPSAAASATPKPSAPSKLPDTGAAETMLGGLLAAGVVLAASGGLLLRRRAR